MLLQPDLEPEENPSSTLQIPVHRRFAAEAQTLLAGVLWALSLAAEASQASCNQTGQ